ncbi:hypothetical protein BBJ28_00024206 [Nothophytophthora sp. Chile5]|nr:hypothetical protein BBJ28_00024206 [Nothophytophthora sp. Chile5]
MDGYRQTLLGRALADALRDLEEASEGELQLDGDQVFALFDEAMRAELRDSSASRKSRRPRPAADPAAPAFTHRSLQLTGEATAFNRFLDDWSVQARVASRDVVLDHSEADLHLSTSPASSSEEEGSVAMLLKLRRRAPPLVADTPSLNMLSSTIKNAARKVAAAPAATRGLAAAASSTKEVEEIGGFGQMTQPKLQLFGVNARYANALYSVAAKQNQLEAVEKELLSIEETIAKEPHFASFLKDPTIARASKKEDISKVMEQAKFSKPVAGLFEVLAENGRLPDTVGVIATYKQLMGAYRGEVQAKVTSADPLSKAQLDQVKKALANRVEKNEKLLLETVVDPEILGGLKVQIGNYFIDLSLATKIDKINTLLVNTSQ